jgi:hypothetical protein
MGVRGVRRAGQAPCIMAQVGGAQHCRPRTWLLGPVQLTLHNKQQFFRGRRNLAAASIRTHLMWPRSVTSTFGDRRGVWGGWLG